MHSNKLCSSSTFLCFATVVCKLSTDRHMQIRETGVPSHFSMMHAEKREGLGDKITCGLLCNRFVQQGIEPYTNRKNKSEQPNHRYGFTRILGGTTSGITALIDWFGHEFSLSLTGVQNSIIHVSNYLYVVDSYAHKNFSFWLDPSLVPRPSRGGRGRRPGIHCLCMPFNLTLRGLK